MTTEEDNENSAAMIGRRSDGSDNNNNNHNHHHHPRPVVVAEARAIPLHDSPKPVEGTSKAAIDAGLVPQPNPNLTNRLGKKRKVGDPPPYDKLIVGGTLSLGGLLLLGAIAILIISLMDRSEFQGAELDDFVSLGPEACRIESTASYDIVEESLDRLNHLCKERYEYNVRIVLDGDEDGSPHNNMTFVSGPLMYTACSTLCNICGPGNFKGDNHYIGVSVTRDGEAITNDTAVECWAPRGPVSDLSNYYTCSNNNQNCYQLKDPSIELDEKMTSSQIGMIAAWVGLAGSAILTMIGFFFVWKNRQAMKEDQKLLMKQQTMDVSSSQGKEDDGDIA